MLVDKCPGERPPGKASRHGRFGLAWGEYRVSNRRWGAGRPAAAWEGVPCEPMEVRGPWTGTTWDLYFIYWEWCFRTTPSSGQASVIGPYVMLRTKPWSTISKLITLLAMLTSLVQRVYTLDLNKPRVPDIAFLRFGLLTWKLGAIAASDLSSRLGILWVQRPGPPAYLSWC